MFEMITFYESESMMIKMSLFELMAMTTVLLQVWLYGRMSLLGPTLGLAGAIMWILSLIHI